MPHTTTLKTRSKRPDTRPNEKLRRKLKGKIEDEKSIQDLRVTRIQKKDRKEREAQHTELKERILSKEEKHVRSLKKKLQAINMLLDKRAGGAELDEQQLIKISTLNDVVQEMETSLEASQGFNKVHYEAFIKSTSRQQEEREKGEGKAGSKKRKAAAAGTTEQEDEEAAAAAAAAVQQKEELSKEEKYVRSVRKKLLAIEQLTALQGEGVKLDAQQQKKVASLDVVMAEMEAALEAVAAAAPSSSSSSSSSGEGKKKNAKK
jgi:uncharacterized protein with WD repeat